MFSRQNKEYIPLESQPDQALDPDFLPTSRIPQARSFPTWTHTTFLLVCIVCTFVNGFICFYPNRSSGGDLFQLSGYRREDIAGLRRPSQFIGFNEIPRPSPPIPRKLENFPILLAQVDSRNPSQVFREDFAAYASHVGTIVPQTKQVLITNSISTIVQFRAVDWGMEKCEIHMDFDHTSSMSPVDIYRLEENQPLDPRFLSYTTKPNRVVKLAVIPDPLDPPGSGVWDGKQVNWRRNVTCGMEEVLSFEFVCAERPGSDSCTYQWFQNPADHKFPGINMVQYSTA